MRRPAGEEGAIDLDRIRRDLERRLATIRGRASKIAGELRDPGVPDSEEQATLREQDEVLLRLDESSVREIADIRAALDRIAAGRYGTCSECGEDIGDARLTALPYTSRCIDCA